MIVDLRRFVAEHRPRWEELEAELDALEAERTPSDVESIERIVRLYELAAADLNRLATFAAAPTVQTYLEALVARAYAELHETRRRRSAFRPWVTLSASFPRALRRRRGSLALAVVATLVGALFGMAAIAFDPPSKASLMPFHHLLGDPSDRVAEEESRVVEGVRPGSATFSAILMQHNIRVSILALALGVTWGLGTLVLLFYNGTILGAVVFDYLQAGEGVFLAGWLLPHGIIEIPAIVIAGTAGLTLTRALFPDPSGRGLGRRFRAAGPDVAALIAGVAAMLVWAGLIEAFLSQLHEPFLPYGVKIAFGVVEGVALVAFLLFAGRRDDTTSGADA